MSSALSPVPPVASTGRDNQVALSQSARPMPPVGPVLSASAIRPPDPVGRAEAIRLHSEQNRPVGPPPAFAVNVLQDIRARLVDGRSIGDPPDSPARSEATIPLRPNELEPPWPLIGRDGAAAVDLSARLDRKV